MTVTELNKRDELRYWNRRANEYQNSVFVHIRQIETLKLVDDFDEWLRKEHPNQVAAYQEWKRDNE